MNDASATASPDLVWSTQTEGVVSIHSPDGTDASSEAAAIAFRTARAVEELVALLEPSDVQREQPVDIYLLDGPDRLTQSAAPEARRVLDAATRGDVIALVLPPVVVAEPIVSQVTRMLIARWYGPDA